MWHKDGECLSPKWSMVKGTELNQHECSSPQAQRDTVCITTALELTGTGTPFIVCKPLCLINNCTCGYWAPVLRLGPCLVLRKTGERCGIWPLLSEVPWFSRTERLCCLEGDTQRLNPRPLWMWERREGIWLLEGTSVIREEQIWLHSRSVPFILTFVFYCFCYKLRMLPIAWNTQNGPFSRLWPLRV